jgi:hypothetical protein
MNKNQTKKYSFQSGTHVNNEYNQGIKPEYNQGIKLKQESKLIERKQNKEAFEKKAADHFENDQDLKNKIFNLSNQFTTFVKDKTLSQNKSPIQLDIEKDVSRQIVDIGLQLNNDESKPEGIGSAGCIMLLLRCTLAQRDIINELGYKINFLEKKILNLESKPNPDGNK